MYEENFDIGFGGCDTYGLNGVNYGNCSNDRMYCNEGGIYASDICSGCSESGPTSGPTQAPTSGPTQAPTDGPTQAPTYSPQRLRQSPYLSIPNPTDFPSNNLLRNWFNRYCQGSCPNCESAINYSPNVCDEPNTNAAIITDNHGNRHTFHDFINQYYPGSCKEASPY